MLRNVFSVILLAIYLIAPVMAAGQDVPGGKWWYNPKIQQNLDLSEKEINKLDKLFAKSRRKLIKLKSEVEHEQFELDQLLGQKKVNDAKVKKQFQKLEKARQHLALCSSPHFFQPCGAIFSCSTTPTKHIPFPPT